MKLELGVFAILIGLSVAYFPSPKYSPWAVGGYGFGYRGMSRGFGFGGYGIGNIWRGGYNNFNRYNYNNGYYDNYYDYDDDDDDYYDDDYRRYMSFYRPSRGGYGGYRRGRTLLSLSVMLQ